MLTEYNYIGDRVFQEQLKVILSNNNLTIKNFKELKSINDDYILVDNYLFTGTSQLYDDIYCMIDLYGVDEDARESYTLELESAGYVFSKDDSTFYTGYDPAHVFAIRLKQYEDNLCIFVYYYSTFYKV